MPEFFSTFYERPITRYALAVVAVTASLVLRFWITQRVDQQLPPFILLYPAIMAVAVLGGLGPGLLATVLGALSTDYFVMQPIGGFSLEKTSDVITLVFFFGMGILMSLLAESYRRSQVSVAAYKVELALRKSEKDAQHASEFSQLALDAARLGTWVFLPQSGEVILDGNCLELLGFQPGEAYTNAALSNRIHPDDGSIVSNAITKSISGADGGLWGMEYRVVWPDGSIHWLTSHGRAYFTGEAESQRAVRLIGVNMDVTGRKNAEETRRESEALYRGLFKSMEEGFCLIELLFDAENKPFDYRFIEASDSYESQTGIPNPVGKTMREIAPPLEDYWFEFYGRVALTGEPAHLISEAKAIDGYYDVRAYRVGKPEQRRVAVVFSEISERMREEKALREQAELLDLAHDAIMVRDLNGTIRFWNDGAKEMYGFSREEAIGRISHELLSAVFPRPLAEIQEIILREGRWEGELTHIAQDGARIVVASRWALRRDLEGKPGEVLEINTDISERIRAEEHTHKLIRVYTVLSDINQTIVREKDSMKILEAACRIAVEKGEFRMAWIGMVDSATQELRPVASSGSVDGYLEQVKIDFRDPDGATGPAARCFFTGEHSTCDDIEHELFRPWRADALRNGYKSVAAFPLKGEGRILGAFCLYAGELAFFDEDEIQVLDEMAMDISYALEVNRHEEERRKAEEELRWRTAFFEAQVDSAIDGIMVVNIEGERLVRNQRLLDLFSFPEGVGAISRNSELRDFVRSMMKNPDEYLAKFDSLNANPEDVSRDEIELANGKILERSSSPVIDKTKKHYGRIWTFRDITERRQLEQQFRQAQKMEAIGQLTGGIAHDFNNLLTVILGCSEVMSEELKDNPRLSKMAEMIAGAAQRGSDLTHRMLAFARRQALQPKPISINQLLAGMESFLRRTLTAEIALQLVQASGECEAIVDPTQMEGALLNLCVNARDAMPGGGRLIIETSYSTLDSNYAAENPDVVPGEYILVTVSDTGSGISREHLSQVFDPFFTTKGVGKGTGLGLSMVYGFVKQSQGHLKIYSEPGLGTSVKIYLPKSTQKSEPARPQNTQFASLRGSETILLVEDNDPVREVAQSQLVNLGYTVLVATNGPEAMELVGAHLNIDLLFTDMAMPGGMNGRDLAIKACEQLPKLKVLICSGYADDAIFQDGIPGRKAVFLNKPYTRLELAKSVREVLTER